MCTEEQFKDWESSSPQLVWDCDPLAVCPGPGHSSPAQVSPGSQTQSHPGQRCSGLASTWLSAPLVPGPWRGPGPQLPQSLAGVRELLTLRSSVRTFLFS